MLVKSGRMLTCLVFLYSCLKARVAGGVQIIRPHKYAPFSRGYGKGSHPSRDITDHFAGLKQLDEATVLGVKSAVPVNFRVVEAKNAILFSCFDDHVRISGEELEAESSILALFANVIELVDNGSNLRVFIQENRCNQVFIQQILVTQI